MEVKTKLNYLRMAPRKVRLLTDLIRGKEALRALNILSFANKRAALPLKKLLESAISNAKNNFQLEEKNLFISEIKVDEGPKLKRFRARARGRAGQIQKKTSHISLILSVLEKKETLSKEKTAEKTPKEEPKSKEIKRIRKNKEGLKKTAAKRVNFFKPSLLKNKIFRRKAF